jgi:hypothetical protein
MNRRNTQLMTTALTALAVVAVFMGWWALQPALRAIGIVFHAVP